MARKMFRNAAEIQFGQAGSIFTNEATQVVAPNDYCIVAIQFLADTTFDELSPVKYNNDYPNGICVGDDTNEEGCGGADAGSETAYMGSGGQIINADSDANLTKFPKGMIIYGRWESFTIDADADGGVIAYLG